MLPLNTSFRHHFIVAFIISLWLVVFLIVIAPYDAADLGFKQRFQILPVYGLFSFVTYIILIPLQNWIFNLYSKWTILHEVLFFIVFTGILLIQCFIYYKSDIVNGEYNFETFTLYVYIPITVIVLSIFIFSRWFINKKKPKQEAIVLKGDNKLDMLKILPKELICISSADNYVEVCYLANGELNKKLLRNTLKVMQQDIPHLLQVHRSYLINPIHFVEWKGSNSIVLTKMEVPVSKKYKTSLLEVL